MSESLPQDKLHLVKLPSQALPANWREYIAQGKAATVDNMDPSCPFLVLEKSDHEKVYEWLNLRSLWVAKSMPNDIISPDPTPKEVRDAFLNICPRLSLVLRKDSVRGFLDLFKLSYQAFNHMYTITAQTLTYMVRLNALRCAKVVLEGKAPELYSCHANPNCMNPYGCFPLHEAAERISVNMIKLLFRYGASANVRTLADAGSQGLLPLHVAVENTCLDKCLVDNLSLMQYRQDYVYKLIHLLCLPEMKVFLDTVRLLAEKTDNLVDELWNYMKNGKVVQTAVLLLAAQKHFRKISPDVVPVITGHLFNEHASLKCDKGDTGEAKKQLEEREALLNCICHLFTIFLRAGKDLDNYIKAHSEVPRVEVLAHVSSILKEFGFCPKEDYIETIKMSPRFPCDVFQGGHTGATKATVTSSVNATAKKTLRKYPFQAWDPMNTRSGFFAYRPVSAIQILCNSEPDDKSLLVGGQRRNYWSTSMSNDCLIPNHNIALLGRNQQLIGTHQSRRYSTVAFKILTKLLKHA